MPSKTINGKSKWQLRAEAELQLRARRGDPEVMPYIQGFTSYRDDPIGFCSTQLKSNFTEPIQRVVESVRDNPVTIAISANDVGKCVAFNERIPLADGRMFEAQDLAGKYFVVMTYGVHGEQYPQLAWAVDNGIQVVYRVTTKFGRSIVRTGNHPLMSAIAHKENPNAACSTLLVEPTGWKPISDLIIGDLVAVPTKLNLHSNMRQNEDHIKLLGYLLGDGGTTINVTFTQQDGITKDEFCQVVERLGGRAYLYDDLTVRVYGGQSFITGSNPIINLARQWGLFGKKSKDKSFPDFVWQLPEDQLALLLNRLFSCDGWAYSRQKSDHIGIMLASEKMIRDVEMAMLRLGINGKVRHRMMNNGRFHAWEWSIHRAEEIVAFVEKVGIFGKEEAVERIVSRAQKKVGGKKAKWPYRSIPSGYRWERVVSIDELEPMSTVTVSVKDTHTFLTTFVEHNSHAAARIAVWFYKAYPDAQVYTTATPEKNLMKILWGEIGSIIQQLPHVFIDDKINNDMNIQRGPQSYITGVAIPSSGTPEQREAKFSGRHAPHILFIVDEADAVPPEVFKGIESCMSGGMARLLVMFNPRADIGAVANMVKRREGNVIHLSAFDHPNVITGEEGIVGAVSREKTVRRINMWSRPLAPGEKPDIECFEVPKFLVGTVAKSLANVEYKPLPPGWRKVENPEFFYMVLGIYPPKSESQLISRVWIDNAVTRWLSYVATYGEVPPKGMRPIAGLDVADMGRDSNQLTLRYGGWVAKQQGWSGVDPDASGIKAHGILKQLGLRIQDLNIFVDATGVGAGVAPRMKRLGAGRTEGVMVASSPTYKTELGEFFQLRDQLWWSVMVWLRDDPGAMLPADEELCDELAAPSYGIKHGKIRITDGDTLRELIGHSPDKASSLALTFAPMPQTVGAWR